MSDQPTTQFTLTLVHETDEARLYRDEKGREQWVPRSICPEVLKLKRPGALEIHQAHIEDWWLKQHPFEKIPATPTLL